MSPRSRQFLSTPSARRATQALHARHPHRCISIHALREEGDRDIGHTPEDFDISIHALREEGDSDTGAMDGVWDLFLSTPSARRATPGLARP